jgi:ketosteroid isomerase-like protein
MGLLERIRMLREDQAREFADHWVKAWNSHDLDRIMSHYEDDVVLVSPVAAKMLGDPSGRVAGKAALRSYFERALEVYPNLSFQLVDVMWGLQSVVLYYTNQKGSKTGEYMEIGPSGKVSRVIANYSG